MRETWLQVAGHMSPHLIQGKQYPDSLEGWLINLGGQSMSKLSFPSLYRWYNASSKTYHSVIPHRELTNDIALPYDAILCLIQIKESVQW